MRDWQPVVKVYGTAVPVQIPGADLDRKIPGERYGKNERVRRHHKAPRAIGLGQLDLVRFLLRPALTFFLVPRPRLRRP